MRRALNEVYHSQSKVWVGVIPGRGNVLCKGEMCEGDKVKGHGEEAVRGCRRCPWRQAWTCSGEKTLNALLESQTHCTST